MASNLDDSMRAAAEKVRQYVEDAAVMQVRTFYVMTGAEPLSAIDPERPGAFTEVKLDGDTKVVVPMRRGRDDTMELDETLFTIHERNVAMATAYRAQVLNALIGLLQRR
ncbi:MAG TPA: hypothetical protein PKD53_24810 [Chloroflexaceae bacterium]|nr:hypothetical protein [Chloroflexaceae bacterium]